MSLSSKGSPPPFPYMKVHLPHPLSPLSVWAKKFISISTVSVVHRIVSKNTVESCGSDEVLPLIAGVLLKSHRNRQ